MPGAAGEVPMLGDLGTYLSSASNRDKVVELLGEHLVLAVLPLLFGLVVAVPLAWVAQRRRWLRAAVFGSANVVYTIPSLALFVLMPGILGTRILDGTNVVVALTLYTAALLVRPVVDALDAVPGQVVAAATAMGYRPLHRFVAVDLPMAVPVLTVGVRMASVSNISLVSVGALIGIGGLGQLFTEGFQSRYLAPIVLGIVATLVLAVVMDLLLVGLRWLSTPWERASVRRSSVRRSSVRRSSSTPVPSTRVQSTRVASEQESSEQESSEQAQSGAGA